VATAKQDNGELSVNAQGLRTQAGLIHYAVGAFGATLPIFVWAGSHALTSAWMAASFGLFAVAWGAFYFIYRWLKTPAAQNLRLRGTVHVLGGLLWAVAVAQIAAMADGAGPARETLLLLALGAGMICVMFTAPWLPSLLIVGPAAIAGPLAAFFVRPTDPMLTQVAVASTAMGFAVALLVNRILRNQYALLSEREDLIADRALQADAARHMARSKSDLVATLSDEIRNGLTGVAHLLSATTSRGAPSRQQLHAATEAVEDLLAVLNTTLDAETAEAGKLSVETRPVDIVALVKDIIAHQRPAASTKGLEISVHLAPEVAHGSGAAMADPYRSRQVLAALIGNAVKFTSRGRVEARIMTTPAGRIRVEVADTGPGLTDEELSLALLPFRRIARTSTGSPGAGLGLPLALRLAELMGGELQAQSALGLGSCFAVELPYDPTYVVGPELIPEAGEPERKRLRILTVDDDQLSATMLRASLEQLGHQVVQAAHGARAVELAKAVDIDLAIVDGRMPGLDGPETIAAIREIVGAAATVPIVALVAEPDEAQECLEAGANALLRKPVAMTALARAVTEALSSPPGSRPAANDRQVA
jgi:signal transduction histidine kinase/ActR/RegA family two-component response regulator